MTLKARCEALGKLGNWLLDSANIAELEAVFHQAQRENGWFDADQCRYAVNQIAGIFLDENALMAWGEKYFTDQFNPKKIGIIMAGNIPAVGFHDLLCVFVSGHQALIKYSDKDKVLISFFIKKLKDINPETAQYFEVIDRLQGADAVIATGSDNSSRYFEYYFSKIPSIIRGNRNSVAVLNGKETAAELKTLGEDIFRYYGLGCRSVSKIYVPRDFNFENFMEQMDFFSDSLLDNSKYKNNYDYNRSVYLLNGTKHWCNDSLILIEETALQSRIACLHYEFYDDVKALSADLEELKTKIQCIVSAETLPDLQTFKFGESQQPKLDDYADGVDSMMFLKNLA